MAVVGITQVLSDMGIDRSVFMEHVYAGKLQQAGAVGLMSMGDYIGRLHRRIDKGEFDDKYPAAGYAVVADGRRAYTEILLNYVSNLTSDGDSTLPEQGQKVLKRIRQQTQGFLDDITSSSDDVSQIGFYKIPETDNGTGFPRIIPSSINIQEHLLNQPVPTVRSKSVGVIPNHSSKHTISIDIIFPNFEVFSSTEEDYPSFINLYNMFKFMPINSIYSSALCTAFVSAYTYPELVKTISKSFAAEEFGKINGTPEERIQGFVESMKIGDTAVLEGILNRGSAELDLGLEAALDHIIGRGQTLDALLGDDFSLKEFHSGGQDNGIAKFPVPVCFKSASLQTMHDMPGAILGRFSFGIVSSPAFPFGSVTYKDIGGHPTLNPWECYWGKRYVSLASKKVIGQLELDKVAVRGVNPGGHDSKEFSKVSNNDIRLYYFDIASGPILFDTTSDRYDRTDTQAPIILEKISGSFNSKTIDMPLMGSKFPNCQYMGLNSSSFQMIFVVTDKKIISDFMAMKARIVDAEKSQFLFNSFGIIENPLVNSFGISRVTPQSVTIESDPDSPDLYRLIINFIENYQDMGNEKLQLEKGVISLKSIEMIWDYLYDLYKIWAAAQPWSNSRTQYGPIDQNHVHKLEQLMRVVGLATDDDTLPTILNPGRGVHGVLYGPVFMGIVDQIVQIRENHRIRKPTGVLSYDFPAFVDYPVNRDAVQNDLLQIAMGAIRSDRQFEATWAGFFRSAATLLATPIGSQQLHSYFGSIFETENKHSTQKIFHSPELHRIFFGLASENPFTEVYKEKDGSYNQDNILGWGVDPTENRYYALKSGYTDVRIDIPFRAYMPAIPSIDNTVYGIRPKGYDEDLLKAKNLVDIFHKQGKIMPKDLWDSIGKCIFERIHTRAIEGDDFVGQGQMSRSFEILSSLASGKYRHLLIFDITTEPSGSEVSQLTRHYDYSSPRNIGNMSMHGARDNTQSSAPALSARLDITRILEISKEVNSFNNSIINLYPDLYLPTYGELFNDPKAIKQINDSFTTSVGIVPNNSLVSTNIDPLMKIFAPKCGDRGVLPNRNPDGTDIKMADLLTMSIADISDAIAASPEHFIDPDIFYFRHRDKQGMAEEANVPSGAAEYLSGRTITLPLTSTRLYDFIIAKLEAAGKKDDNEILQLNRDRVRAALNEAMTGINAGMHSATNAPFEAIAETMRKVFQEELGAQLDDKTLENIYNAYKDGNALHIEFITEQGTVVGGVQRTDVKTANDEESVWGYKVVNYGKAVEPMYYSSVSDLSIAMDDPEAIEAIHRQQIAHIPDHTESVLRSFPTIRLYFIEEDRDRAYHQDDFYGFGEVVECSISSHIYDNDICTMKLANFGGVLSTMAFSDHVSTRKIKKSPSSEDKTTESEDKTESSTNLVETNRVVDEEGEKFLRKIMLRPGIHIMVKMGYGNNIEHLKTVFTGEISEVKAGSIVEIVAQGFQSELQNDFGGFLEEDWISNLRHLIPFVPHPHTRSFLNVINYILLGDIASSKKLLRKGMSHLGEPIQFSPHKKGGPFSERTQSWDYGTADNNISRILGGEFDTVVGFQETMQGDTYSWLSESLERNYFGFSGFDLTRNIYNTTSNHASVNMANEWLVTNGPVIDGLREVTRYMPNFIATVVPYKQDATLFIGDPSGVYEFRPPTEEESKYQVKYNFGSKYKQQEQEFGKHAKYIVLFQQINNLSNAIKRRVEEYNRIKTIELLHIDELVKTVGYKRIIAAETPGGTAIASEQSKSRTHWEDEDLERLVYNVYFNPWVKGDLGNKKSHIDEVHANLLGIFLNLSKENIKDNSKQLTKLSQQIGEFYLDSKSHPSAGSSPEDMYMFHADPGGELYKKGGSGAYSDTTRYHNVWSQRNMGFSQLKINGLDVNVQELAPNLIMSNESDISKLKLATRVTGIQDHNHIVHFRFLEGLEGGKGRHNSTIRFEPFMDNIRSNPKRTLAERLNPLLASDGAFTQSPRFLKHGLDLDAVFFPRRYRSSNDNSYGDLIRNFILPYKQVLLLASQILNDEDPDEVESTIRELMTGDEDIRTTLPYNYKIFRDHHVVSTTHDLIANNIVATESDMWSAVRLLVPIDTVDETAGFGNWGFSNYGIEENGIDRSAGVFRIASNQGFGSWPHADSAGMNYRGMYPAPKDILETFTEINATTPNLAKRAMTFRIAQGLSKMYRGSLIMIGRNMKPYDAIHLADDVNNMYGVVMAERVIQNFSAVNGWTTTVVPCALSTENSWLGTYERSLMKKFWYTVGNGRAFGQAMNILTVVSVIVPMLGGIVMTAGVAANVVIRTVIGAFHATRALVPFAGGGRNAFAAIKAAGVAIGKGTGHKYLPGVLEAVRSTPGTGKLARVFAWTTVARGPGTATSVILGQRFSAGARLVFWQTMVGRIGLRGGGDIVDQFMSPMLSQTSVLSKAEGDDFNAGTAYLPAKINLLRYNGAPFASGLENMYDALEHNDAWSDLSTELGYWFREWMAAPTEQGDPLLLLKRVGEI
jgi:hypothetical protein